MNKPSYIWVRDHRPGTQDLPYAYRKNEKRFRAKRVRRDGATECKRQLQGA